MSILLVPAVLVTFLLQLQQIGLHVRQTHVDLRVLQLVVLVKTALRPIGFATNFHRTFVIPLNLICIPSHSFTLIVHPLALTVKFFILNREGVTSYFLRRVMS